MQVLGAGAFFGEESAEGGAVFRGRLPPILLDRVPALTEALFVGIAILRNDGADAFGMVCREAQADRRAVIEDVDREAIESDSLGEFAATASATPSTISRP